MGWWGGVVGWGKVQGRCLLPSRPSLPSRTGLSRSGLEPGMSLPLPLPLPLPPYFRCQCPFPCLRCPPCPPPRPHGRRHIKLVHYPRRPSQTAAPLSHPLTLPLPLPPLHHSPDFPACILFPMLSHPSPWPSHPPSAPPHDFVCSLQCILYHFSKHPCNPPPLTPGRLWAARATRTRATSSWR